MALDIKQYEKGRCFICTKECDKEGYVHDYCALAFQEDHKKRMREALLNNQKLC